MRSCVKIGMALVAALVLLAGAAVAAPPGQAEVEAAQVVVDEALATLDAAATQPETAAARKGYYDAARVYYRVVHGAWKAHHGNLETGYLTPVDDVNAAVDFSKVVSLQRRFNLGCVKAEVLSYLGATDEALETELLAFADGRATERLRGRAYMLLYWTFHARREGAIALERVETRAWDKVVIRSLGESIMCNLMRRQQHDDERIAFVLDALKSLPQSTAERRDYNNFRHVLKTLKDMRLAERYAPHPAKLRQYYNVVVSLWFKIDQSEDADYTAEWKAYVFDVKDLL